MIAGGIGAFQFAEAYFAQPDHEVALPLPPPPPPPRVKPTRAEFGFLLPETFWGSTGWSSVPTSWYARVTGGGEVEVSPLSDFSESYFAKTNHQGTLVIFTGSRRTLDPAFGTYVPLGF
jgi:hypothetical protein